MNFFRRRVTQATNKAALMLLTLGLTISAKAQEPEGASALPDLVPFEATYTAFKWGDDVGNATMKLEPLADKQFSLTYSSRVSKFFLSDERFEHSIFMVDDDSLVPSQYHYTRTGTGPDSEITISFEKSPSPTVVVEGKDNLVWEDELDNQLYRIDLGRQLAIDKRDLGYDFINYRGQKRHYGIRILGNETLALPFGKLETIKVKLVRDSKSRQTYAWYSPELDYQLVRLQQFKDGDEQGDIKLKAYKRL
jgi:hypothetical protein